MHYINVRWQVDATFGDLAGGRYYSGDCVAAVTLGLTTNAVYVESSQFVPNGRSKHGEMVIPLFNSIYFNYRKKKHPKEPIVVNKSVYYFRLLICNGATSIHHIFL